jgi:hypothetical protein
MEIRRRQRSGARSTLPRPRLTNTYDPHERALRDLLKKFLSNLRSALAFCRSSPHMSYVFPSWLSRQFSNVLSNDTVYLIVEFGGLFHFSHSQEAPPHLCDYQGDMMTRDQSTALQTKWEQRGNPPPLCEHLSQVASLVVLSRDDHVTSTYHCRECGEEIVHNYKPPPFSNTPLFD